MGMIKDVYIRIVKTGIIPALPQKYGIRARPGPAMKS
jgi:hypothetical protein